MSIDEFDGIKKELRRELYEEPYDLAYDYKIRILTSYLFELHGKPKIQSQVSAEITSDSIIEIEGQWSAEDFSQLFLQASLFYKQIIESCVRKHAYFLWEKGIEGDHKEHYYSALNYYKSFDFYKLQVKSIKYGSPGSVDFTGLGAALGHIKELILAYIPTKEQRLKNEMYRLEIIKKTFDILRENKVPDSEINEILMNTEVFFGDLSRNNKVKTILLDNSSKSQKEKG